MVDSPDYIAFRLPDGDALLTVVAALEPGERGSFPWAKWYSDSAPSGEFRKVPGGYARFVINDAVASTMIDAIRAGRSLPEELIEQLGSSDARCSVHTIWTCTVARIQRRNGTRQAGHDTSSRSPPSDMSSRLRASIPGP